ncbi:MAG: elongator complex protein 3 [Thermoproteota archaeon]|nr:elongator complex protein 3 [Thermoproteota archaeon]
MRNSILNERACREVIEKLLVGDIGRGVDNLKLQTSKKYGLTRIPPNSEVLAFATDEEKEKIRPLLQLKPIRSLSGVNVIAAMTKPFDCPHGKCAYCPGGTKYNVPSSYTGKEPATMRGIQNNFDPYLQVKCRINQLRTIGHIVNKTELIVMGGTFPSTPVEYQEYFIKGCLDAITDVHSKDLEEAKRLTEKSAIKNVGITFETRPDWAAEKHVKDMLRMGVTRVELGVQTVFDDVYKLIGRGHTVDDVARATRTLKDAGLKVCYHIMPGLPGSNLKKDLEVFRTLFSDSRFKPDELKIYPTLVLEGTKLYDMWVKGEYQPPTDEELIQLLVDAKSQYVPRFARIKRITRDIPAPLIVAGPRMGNLREVVWDHLQVLGKRCNCIRCREVGLSKAKLDVDPALENVKLRRLEYEASNGIEVFLSYEDVKQNILIGFLRLRVPVENGQRGEVNEDKTVIVRELHVYGPLVSVGVKPTYEKWQHRGYGRMLLDEAEKMGRERFDAKKVLVTSGLGVKEYYRQLKYEDSGPYMSKLL